MTRKNITYLAIVIAVGLIFQAGFAALDNKETPADTAVSFARAYYRLDPSLVKWMAGASSAGCGECTCGNEGATFSKAHSGDKSSNCSKADPAVTSDKTTSGNESAMCAKTDCPKAMSRRINTAIDNFLYQAKLDASKRGFKENFVKYTLYKIETRTEYLDDTTALVHLTAHRRICVNPVYAYVARLFRIGDTYKVDESVRVKLEDGRWQVCDSSLLA